MATRRVLSVTGDIALQLLRLTAASADVFPPLKSAAGDALYIAEIVKKFRSNKAEWQEFQDYVQNATASVVHSLAQTDLSQTDVRDRLDTLRGTMENIIASVKAKHDRPRYIRVYKFIQDRDMISEIRKRLEDAVGLFTLISVITTEINVGKTLDAVVTNSKILSGIARDTAATVANTASLTVQAVSISHKTSQIALNATLQRLQHVQGASWDLYRTCLPNTRINIIDDVFAWVDEAGGSSGAQIYLLTAVAGAGKTTVAHTVAHHFHERGQLVSSFFFDRETQARNTPIALFTTIAADLARVSGQLADRITAAIENEQGLPLAPLSRQFQELVLKPCQGCAISRPLVIVIDALDEGFNHDLLKILRDDVPRLPSAFRIFLTSRMQPDIDNLCRRSHVRLAPLDINSSANLLDMNIFVRHRLQQLAEARGFDSDWPGEQLRSEFEARAAGLFIWVTTVCDYILSRTNPRRELEKLVSGSRPAKTSAELKMDKLYAMILDSCDWDDEDFSNGYHRAMGTALATKTPLTISAWNMLFDDKPAVSDFVLQKLSALLTGMSKDRHETQSVRVLHQSLRDFLVVRAGSLPECTKFRVDEQKHSQNLALLCLRLLNGDLYEGMAGVGYLAKDESECPGIPKIEDAEVSEALWYACQFWIDHVLDVKPAAPVELRDALELFMETKADLTELLINLDEKHMRLGIDVVERLQQSDEAHAVAFCNISSRLNHEGRWAEALAATQEAVQLYRELVRDRPTVFAPGLAQALTNLSADLFSLGCHEDALAAAQEGIQLYRELVKNTPAVFAPKLAQAFTNRSLSLSSLGRHKDALAAAQEGIQLYRELVKNNPAVFAPKITQALSNLSVCLTSLGRHEDALAAAQEAIQLYRELVKNSPVVFASNLADALTNLSLSLSSLGRHKDALAAAQEGIQLYRELVKSSPAVFALDLAQALSNLSAHLTSLGRHEDALAAVQEAIQLYRELVKDRQAVIVPKLADALNNLSFRLSALSRHEDALAAIQEAMELYRELARERPALFTYNLANGLDTLSTCLSGLSRHEDSLAAMQEAMALYRELAKDPPARFAQDFAEVLSNFSRLLSTLDRPGDALDAIQEATALYRQLAADRPAVFTEKLASSLDILFNSLTQLDRHDEACFARQEAEKLKQGTMARIVAVVD
ncbi:hypothetical protein BDV93DRAFT_515736 [Ceratobasidium sp. AG-I]|nr:hypothetical protein BDV93DRAFT_515736 [Ceratobasidium sp. AG-I]